MKAYSLDLLTLNVIDHTQWCYWWGQCFAPLGPILWCLWLFHIYLFSLIWKNQHTILLLNRSGINYHINSMSESYNHNYHWKQIFVLSCLVCKTLLFFTKFSSVQSLSHVRLFATPWIAACQVPVHHQLPEFTQTHVHRVSDAIQPCHPLSSPSPPAPNPSQHQSLFQWVNSSHEVAKVWSFSFSIIPSKEIPGLISFRMDWLDLLAVQETHKSLLQLHISKASILWCSAFFTVQLSHPYMTTGKTIALTKRSFVGKVMSLLLNMLSRLVITFLPRSKCLLISWLQSPSAVILELPK